jgi:Ca-activated chloride channel family protein
MSSLSAKLSLCAAILGASMLWAQAQEPAKATEQKPSGNPSAIVPANSSDEVTFRTDTRLVDLHATVVDRDGRLVLGLPQSAFSVYENGVKQEIKVFRQEDAPVSLGLIIDNSASMHDKRAKVGSAALGLVAASNPDDEVFIMNFSDQPTLERDFTNNIKALEETLKKIDSKGETAMRDALLMGIEHLRHGAKREKKVLLVVTDGEDNNSVETIDHLVQTAQQNGVLIYAIGLLSDEDPRTAERAKKQLDLLTFTTGGQSWYPKEVSEVDGIAREVAHEVRNQYALAYTSSNQALDGTFRKIRAEVKAPGDPKVRTRTGYWASR